MQLLALDALADAEGAAAALAPTNNTSTAGLAAGQQADAGAVAGAAAANSISGGAPASAQAVVVVAAAAVALEAVAEAACALLVGTVWDGELGAAKAARDELAGLLGVQVRRGMGAQGAGRGTVGGGVEEVTRVAGGAELCVAGGWGSGGREAGVMMSSLMMGLGIAGRRVDAVLRGGSSPTRAEGGWGAG